MYQSYIQLLEEAGYQKFMSDMGPVYIQDKNREIIYLTYHKTPEKEYIDLEKISEKLKKLGAILFSDLNYHGLCIVLVDDSDLKPGQLDGFHDISVWIQDELTGKLYITQNSHQEFVTLYEHLKQKQSEAKQELQETEKRETNKEIWKSFVTPVNTWIIVINIGIFLCSTFIWKNMIEWGASNWYLIMKQNEYYRILTSIFLHFDLEHLLSNMLVLFLIGNFVERYYGGVSYGIAYFLCGSIGNLVSLYTEIGADKVIISAGASGAIYGILGMLAILLIRHRGRLEGIRGPGVIIFVAGSLIYNYQSAGVDNMAHLGGAVSGMIIALLWKRRIHHKD